MTVRFIDIGAQRRYHTGLRSNPVSSWPQAIN
jgi:hypothetical protein